MGALVEFGGVSLSLLQVVLLGVCFTSLFITTVIAVALCCTYIMWRREQRIKNNRGEKSFIDRYSAIDFKTQVTSPAQQWSAVTTGDTYGSFTQLKKTINPSSHGKDSGTHERQLPPDKYIYARIRLFLVISPDNVTSNATLIAIETNRLNFVPRDIFLELRNCVDSETQATKAVGFNISVSRMRKRYDLPDKVHLNTDHPVFNAADDKNIYADFAKLFERRGIERRYIATGYSTELRKSYSCDTLDQLSDKGRHVPPGSRITEIYLSFLCDQPEKVGRVKVSMAYLPTAEKISIEILECILQKPLIERYKHVSDCYWKLTLMHKNKRHSRRRLKSVPFTHHVTYKDGLDTFDWVSRDTVHSFTFVLTLTGILDDSGGSTVSSESESTHSDVTSLPEVKESRKSERRSSRDQRTVTLGELFVGGSVPSDKCAAQWQSMLLQPRQVISRWQELY